MGFRVWGLRFCLVTGEERGNPDNRDVQLHRIEHRPPQPETPNHTQQWGFRMEALNPEP